MEKKHDEDCQCKCDEEHDHECGCENGHNHDEECGCGCGHNHEFDEEDYEEEMDIIYLTLDDDTEMECAVLGIFEVEDDEYIALVPLDEEEVFLYRFIEEGDEFELLTIDDDEEFETVSEAFQMLFVEEDLDFYDDEDLYDEEDDE